MLVVAGAGAKRLPISRGPRSPRLSLRCDSGECEIIYYVASLPLLWIKRTRRDNAAKKRMFPDCVLQPGRVSSCPLDAGGAKHLEKPKDAGNILWTGW